MTTSSTSLKHLATTKALNKAYIKNQHNYGKGAYIGKNYWKNQDLTRANNKFKKAMNGRKYEDVKPKRI